MMGGEEDCRIEWLYIAGWRLGTKEQIVCVYEFVVLVGGDKTCADDYETN